MIDELNDRISQLENKNYEYMIQIQDMENQISNLKNELELERKHN